MNTIQRITKNVSLLLISQIFSYVFGFFTLMYSARYLGVDGFGTLSLAMAFTGIFSVSMDLGLNSIIIRDIAREKSITDEHIGIITFMKIVFSIITFILIFIFVNLFGYTPETMKVIYLIALYTVFTVFAQLFLAVFQAHEKMEYRSVGTVLSSIFLLLGILIAMYYNFDIIQFSSIYVVVGALFLAYSLLIFSWKFYVPSIKLDINKWIPFLKESWPFALSGISINLYLWIDTIILSIIQGSDAVGIYNAAYKLILILLFVTNVFYTTFFPLMSKYYISSKENLIFSFEKLFKIMMLFAIPIGVGTVFLSNKIILLIYGNQFSQATLPLQILIWSTVLVFARTSAQCLLESSNKQLVMTKIFLIATLFNILLNILVIPKYSYLGASVITVLTDALIFGISIIAISRIGISIPNNFKISLLKISLASVVMGIILNYILSLNIFLIILISVLSYTILLLILKIFDKDEIYLIKSILKRKE